MARIFFILIIIFCYADAKAQQAEDSVKTIIEKMFTAMKNSDGQTLASCFADSAILQTIKSTKEGRVVVSSESISAFAGSVSKAPKAALDERFKIELIKTDGDLASVWVPYSFYFNDKFSHCGVNSFQLVRQAGEWKIQYIIDTRRRTNCL
jgi:hypothetical protein